MTTHRFTVTVEGSSRDEALGKLCQVLGDAADNPERENVGVILTEEDLRALSSLT